MWNKRTCYAIEVPNFSHHVLMRDHTFSEALTGTPLLATGASLILISLSSWYVKIGRAFLCDICENLGVLCR